MKGTLKYFLIALAVIIADHVIKLLIHFTLEVHGEGVHLIGDVVKLQHVLNPGMAFGIELDFLGNYKKIFLSLFRLSAMFAISWYLVNLYKKKSAHGLMVCVALILGGAVGNLLDSVFYGVFLEGNKIPEYHIMGNEPSFYPWFHGQVIDMFSINWTPWWDYNWPVFNFADAAIFFGVIIILIKSGTYFKESDSKTAQPIVEPGIPSGELNVKEKLVSVEKEVVNGNPDKEDDDSDDYTYRAVSGPLNPHLLFNDEDKKDDDSTDDEDNKK